MSGHSSDKIRSNITNTRASTSDSVFLFGTDYTNSQFNVCNDSDLFEDNKTDSFTSDTLYLMSEASVIPPVVISTMGVGGNILALILLFTRPSSVSKSTTFYLLVKILAVTDLTGIITLGPAVVLIYGTNGIMDLGGQPLCNLFSTTLVTAGFCSLLIVLAMSTERFIVTKYTFIYAELVTKTRVYILLVGIILLSLFVGLLPTIGVGHNEPRFPGTWCLFNFRSTDIGSYINTTIIAVIGFFIIIITFYFNAYVIKHVWRMRTVRLTRATLRGGASISTIESRSKSSYSDDTEGRMIIFLLCMTVLFTLCNAPLMFRVVINQFVNAGRDDIPNGGLDDRLDLLCIRLASLNQILDPWVYIISRITCCGRMRRQPSMRNQIPSNINQPYSDDFHRLSWWDKTKSLCLIVDEHRNCTQTIETTTIDKFERIESEIL